MLRFLCDTVVESIEEQYRREEQEMHGDQNRGTELLENTDKISQKTENYHNGEREYKNQAWLVALTPKLWRIQDIL